MFTPEIFIIFLFVLVDDFFNDNPIPPKPGPKWSLIPSEAVTLLIYSQWARFRSEQDFYRHADQKLRYLFPNIPCREQLNRQWRSLHDYVCKFFCHLAEMMEAEKATYEALDATAIVTRDAKRRGDGWLAGKADIGHSNRLGWYEGFKMLLASTPEGIITGFGISPASDKEQPMAETFFCLRANASEDISSIASIGQNSNGCYYPVDKGFEGRKNQRLWKEQYGVTIIYSPRRNSREPWSKELRKWLASIRQIVETVFDKLLNTFRLDRERPHELQGLRTRLAAKVALHNFCIWLNRQYGRNNLAFADLLGW
jgi:hypothetical protein